MFRELRGLRPMLLKKCHLLLWIGFFWREFPLPALSAAPAYSFVSAKYCERRGVQSPDFSRFW